LHRKSGGQVRALKGGQFVRFMHGKEVAVQGIGHRLFLCYRWMKLQLADCRNRQCKDEGENQCSHAEIFLGKVKITTNTGPAKQNRGNR